MNEISLSAARINAKLTQKELANAIGVDEKTVWNWENGVSVPDVNKAKKISQVCGISLDCISFT